MSTAERPLVMLYLYVILTGITHTLTDGIDNHTQRLRARLRDDDRGSVTLEQVIISLALFTVAALAIAAIVAAVKTRYNQIK